MIKQISSNIYEVMPEDSHVKCSVAAVSGKVILPKSYGFPNRLVTISKTDSSANTVTIHVARHEKLYEGTQQVETSTVVGTVTKAGNATVVFTSANISASPITLSVAVLVDDTASIVADKIRIALAAHAEIGNYDTGAFVVSGSGATVVVTSVEYFANDSTLNISVDNGTCEGLTTAASSANTTTGVSLTLTVQNDFKTFVCDGIGWGVIDSSPLASTQTLTNKTLTSPTINTPVITSPDITFGSSAHDYAAGATAWTLSAAELKSFIITATNANGAVDAIATPTANKVYLIANSTGQALTFKATGQTGVTIASTKTAFVRGNGTDFVRVTADV